MNQVEYTYDNYRRLTQEKHTSADNAALNRTVNYTYNRLTETRTTVTDQEETVTLVYDAKGNLLSQTDSKGTKQYTYDSKGRLDTYTSPSGLVLKYGYNTVNDLCRIIDNSTDSVLWEISVYNSQGLIAIENGLNGRQTRYSYDEVGRPLTISNDLSSFTYTYNVGGQLTRRVENFGGAGLTETFAYDAGGCLTSSTLQGKTPVTVSYNSGRGITNKSDIGTYSYGANGAPLATVNPVSGYNPSAQSITYNSSNLPASITQGGYTRTYTYDVNDQRDYSVLTKSNTTLPFAASKRYYFGDFERNINTENGVVTDSNYIFADGRLVALVKTTGGTKTAYGVLTDRQGSLRALYNGSGLVQSFSYDAWGNRRNPSTGNALTTSELVTANSITSRGYTCHEHMDEFGLINMNARIYDPALGMFISVDPLAQEYYDTYPYAYCGGDPVNRVDWTGEDWYQHNETKHYVWLYGNKEREGYTYIGCQGSVLGEFEPIIDELLIKVYNVGSMYRHGFSFDIAPNDKGALIGSEERGWNFLDEFVNGVGPEISIMLSDHPYTQEMKTSKRVLEGQQKITSGKTDIMGQITEVKGKWGLWDVFKTFSIAKQFVGSYRYDAFTSKDGKYLNNVISDSKSRSSLLYHLYPSKWNKNRSQEKFMSNTYQFYIWKSKK